MYSSLCVPHSQQAIYLGKSQDKNQWLCQICVQNTKCQFRLISELQTNIEISKSILIQFLKERNLQNIQTLQKLHDEFNSYIENQTKSFKLIMQTIEQTIKDVGKENDSLINKIQYFNTLDVDELINTYQQLSNDKILMDKKLEIQQQISTIYFQSKLFFIYDSLEKFPSEQMINYQILENYKAFNQQHLIPKCVKHNQDIIGIDFKTNQSLNESLICQICQSNNPKTFQTYDEIIKIWEEYQSQKKISQQNQIALFKKYTHTYKYQLFRKYDLILNKFKQIICQIDKSRVEIYKRVQQKQNSQSQYLKSLTDLQEMQSIFYNNGHISNNQNISLFPTFDNYITKIEGMIKQKQPIHNFQYKLLNEDPIQFKDQCLTLAINCFNNILAAGCLTLIKIFEIKDSQLIEKEVLEGHSKDVVCLYFFNKSNRLLSGSFDFTIKLWVYNSSNQWILFQTFVDHNESIISLLINLNDDLIISSSQDLSIKFWNLDCYRFKVRQTIKTEGSIYGLSLSNTQTKLITCGSFQQITIYEMKSNKQWILFQTIILSYAGFRLCFLNDDIFSFQPSISQIHLYEFQKNSKKFQKVSEIDLNENLQNYDGGIFFPQKFINQKSLLLNKYGKFIYILQKNDQDEFKIKQTLEITNWMNPGCLSNDGELLITVDHQKKELEIRKYSDILQ